MSLTDGRVLIKFLIVAHLWTELGTCDEMRWVEMGYWLVWNCIDRYLIGNVGAEMANK